MGRRYDTRVILNFLGQNSGRLEKIAEKKWPELSEAKKVHVINVRPTDTFEEEKYALLKQCNRRSKVYLVAHHYPKKNAIFNHDNSRAYSLEEIAGLLCKYIQSPDVCLNQSADFLSDSRQLTISFIACHAGRKLGVFGKGPSFAEKLFVRLLNDSVNPIVTEIHASKMFVAPVPCKPEEFKRDFKKIEIQPSFEQTWHKRYIDAPFYRGQVSPTGYAFYSYFRPSDEPPGDYKQIIKYAPDKKKGYEILSIKESKIDHELSSFIDETTVEETELGSKGEVNRALITKL